MIPQPWALIFWLVVGVLVGFYVWVINATFGPVLYESICGWCTKNKEMAVVGAFIFIAVIATLLYGLVWLP